jgi:ribosomal protein S19
MGEKNEGNQRYHACRTPPRQHEKSRKADDVRTIMREAGILALYVSWAMKIYKSLCDSVLDN